MVSGTLFVNSPKVSLLSTVVRLVSSRSSDADVEFPCPRLGREGSRGLRIVYFGCSRIRRPRPSPTQVQLVLTRTCGVSSSRIQGNFLTKELRWDRLTCLRGPEQRVSMRKCNSGFGFGRPARMLGRSCIGSVSRSDGRRFAQPWCFVENISHAESGKHAPFARDSLPQRAVLSLERVLAIEWKTAFAIPLASCLCIGHLTTSLSSNQ